MSQVKVSRTINASKEKVFETVSDISNFSKAVPHIIKVEFLSEIKKGVGAKFEETRLMKGKEASVILEVTEFKKNENVRLVSDAGGTIWDTIFSVRADGDNTMLEMVMDANPYKVMAKMVTPLIMGMVRKGIEDDMDSVKKYCEEI